MFGTNKEDVEQYEKAMNEELTDVRITELNEMKKKVLGYDKIREGPEDDEISEGQIFRLADFIMSKRKFYTIRDKKSETIYTLVNNSYVPYGDTYIREITMIVIDCSYNVNIYDKVCKVIRACTYITMKELCDKANKHKPCQNVLDFVY